jgi:hypothetical protein
MSLLLLLLLLQAGRCGPDPAVLHTLRSCELLECLTTANLASASCCAGGF